MSDESYLVNHKKERRWLSRLAKLVFFLVAFFLITLVVLANMGGTSDLLRESAEKFVSEVFGGRPARIERLVNISFFPKVGIDAHDIKVLSSEETPYPVIRIGKFQSYMGFWTIATSKPRFSHVYLEKFHAMKGILNPQDVKIDKVFIDYDAVKNQAFLRGSGALGVHRWTASLGLDVLGSGKSRKYSFMTRAPLVFDIADIHFETVLHDHPDGYFKLEDVTLSSEKHHITADFALSTLGEKLLKVQGTLMTSEGQTEINTDLVFDLSQEHVKVSGGLSAPSLLFHDISASEKSQFLGLYKRIRHILGYDMVVPGVAFEGYDFDLDVNVDIQNIILSPENTFSAPDGLAFSIFKEGGFWRSRPVIGGGEQYFPAVSIIHDPDNSYAVFQSGRVDTSLLELYLPFVFSGGHDAIDVACAVVGTVTRDGKQYFDYFAIKSAQGQVNKTLGQPYDSSNPIDIVLGDDAIIFPEITLPRDAYDFVKGTFQESGRDVPCAAYVMRSAEKEAVDDMPPADAARE